MDPTRPRAISHWFGVNPRLLFIGTVAAATVLRLWLAVAVDAGDWIYSDMANYDRVARQWQRLTITADDTMIPPGYPIFLAVLYEISGRSLVVVRLVQAVLGGLTCLLGGLIARQLSGTHKAAVVAAAIIAFYPPLVYYGGLLLTEAVAPFCWALTVWLLLLAVQHRRYAASAAGLSFGIATLIRPNSLILLPGILAFLWVACRPSTFRALRMSLVVLATAVPVLTIAVAVNSRAVGRLAGISTNGGLNFFLLQADVATLAATNGNWSPIRNMLFYSGVFRVNVASYDESFFYREGLSRLLERDDILAHTMQNLREGFGLGEQGYWPANGILLDNQQGGAAFRSLLRLASRSFFWLLMLPSFVVVSVTLAKRQILQPESAPMWIVLAMLFGMVVTSVTFLADPRMHVPFDVVFISYLAAAAAQLTSGRSQLHSQAESGQGA